MLFSKTLKSYILRIVCMVMLMLIQFDVCGYDIICAFQQSEEPQSVLVLNEDESLISDGQDQISEWSDPVYRNTSLRSISDAMLPVIVIFLFSSFMGELSVIRRGYCTRTDISVSHSYILFRVFRI